MAVCVAALAGCSSGGDNPALPLPTTPEKAAVSAGQPGPAVSIERVGGIPVPQLAGYPSVNASLRRIGATLDGTCTLTTARDDPELASFEWNCGSRGVTTATYSLREDRRLTLSDILSAGYAAYLSSTAASQLRADGIVNPQTDDLSAWDLTPYELQVFFPAGTVSFPLDSLGAYVERTGPLGP